MAGQYSAGIGVVPQSVREWTTVWDQRTLECSELTLEWPIRTKRIPTASSGSV
jgi:hypothetical protein